MPKTPWCIQDECDLFLNAYHLMLRETKNELLTVAETCRYLKITPRTLYRYIQDRRLPAFKLGKEWRFVRSDLEQWIRERASGPQA